MAGPDVLVAGRIGRDLVLRARALPDAGGSAPVEERHELLGGKGANQAVGLTQLGLRTALLGVLGDDPAGAWLRDAAADDGIDTTAVVTRAATASALLVDVVVDGARRLLEHVPDGVLLSVDDVRAASARIETARAVVVQLQEPPEATVAVAELAHAAGALVVLDGAPAPQARDRLLTAAGAVRADATETEALVGRRPSGGEDVLAAARELVGRHGLVLAALDAGAEGNAVAWPGGSVLVPLGAVEVVDPTGGGDSFVAASTAGLLHGLPGERIARLASEASGATVRRLGGRPALAGLRGRLRLSG